MRDNVDCTQYLSEKECRPSICSHGRGTCQWAETTSYFGKPFKSCTCVLNAPKRARFDDFDDLFDDFDEEEDFEFAARPISPWPSLLRRAIQALQSALRALSSRNARGFSNALSHAESLIRQAAQEVRRVMSGSRHALVLDQLSNAFIRIQTARAQARGGSLVPGGRSFIDPRVSVRGAIAHIRQAQNAVDLRLV